MFNEQTKELGLPVFHLPKYKDSRAKAIEIIDSGRYGLSEADFWILMNKSKDGKYMLYSGLIISHNGCKKINDASDNKIKPECFTIDKEGYGGSLVFTYKDNETYVNGEVAPANCKNSYPYAMAFKRCYDRAVLDKCKLAYSGIYSEVEADEFKKSNEPTQDEITEMRKQLNLEGGK